MTEGTPAGPEAKDFFVSHAGGDRAWAEWVAWHLLEAGYTVELDAWDWAAGENFVARMHRAVDAADRVVALLSPAYFEDGRYTAEEWSAALVKEDEGGGHRLVPVQVERCALPRLLRPLLRAELFGIDEQEAVRRLLDAVRGPRRPDGAPVFPGRGSAGELTGRGEAGPRLPGVLPPVWNVGPRNPGFVGRRAALASVHERLRSGGAAVVQALHGLGGVGKSQMALEYAHRYADFYDIVWWVNAAEAGLVGEQFAALAAELGLTGPHTDTATAVSALRAYLRGRGRWLLVLDNAESPGDVRGWLPGGPGHILITSRNPGVGGELAARVAVDVLPRTDSVALLRTYRPDVVDADAGWLADALGDLPLALAQAGGFLAETGMAAAQYLGLLGDRAAELLDESPPEGHPLSLAAAIRLSTERLAQVDPAALALVRVGAFLAPEPIPADLLTSRVPLGGVVPPELEVLAAVVASPVAAHRSLGRAGRYGLARVERGLQLHRLTQAVVRDQLTAEQAAVYRAYAQALLAAADPGEEPDPASWPGWAQILPHLLATDPAGSPDPGLRDLACRATWYLSGRGDDHEALDLADGLYRRWRERLGPDDPHVLWAARNIVRLLVNLGADLGPSSRARDLGHDTLARCRRTLGDDHPHTLDAAHQLARFLHYSGAFEQARQLDADSLDRKRRVFGDGAEAAATAHQLGLDLYKLGELAQAQQLHEYALTRRRQALGDDHPETINTANALGRVLSGLGRPEAARRLHEESLARGRRVLGEDHRYTLSSAASLARDLHALGDVEAARQLTEHTLAHARRRFGDDSVYTIGTANDLATDLLALGEADAARRLSENTLATARRALGMSHPYTTRTADNLAAALAAGAATGPARDDDPGSVAYLDLGLNAAERESQGTT